jgi:hypothetical protein
MKRNLFAILILTAPMARVIALGGAAARGADESASARGIPGAKTSTVKIRIIVENKTLNATLDNNTPSQEFVSLLPLRLTLRDFAAAEKISEMPTKLSIQGGQ